MMAYLDRLRALEAQNGPDGLLTKPTKPLGRLHKDPVPVVHGWVEALRSVDPCAPPDGWEIGRWQVLFDCSVWWIASFGEQAAGNGWTTGDVFAVHSERVGGLVDRLGDNRSLMMTADRACWRSFGVARSFNRMGGLGLRPFWEAKA